MTDLPVFLHGQQPGPAWPRQRGVTLVVSLIFLLILTILGVTAINTSSLQQKMAGNLRDSDMALQSAETGLRGGEAALNTLFVGSRPVANSTGSNGVWLTGSTDVLTESWWNAHSVVYSGSVTNAYANPRYLIEGGNGGSDDGLFVPDTVGQISKYSPGTGTSYYNITAGAVGVSPVSRAMLQETYRIRSN